MDVDQSSPRFNLLPHHSYEGQWEFPIEDITSSVEGVSALFPHRKVPATEIYKKYSKTAQIKKTTTMTFVIIKHLFL
jgi:hypothetical protein